MFSILILYEILCTTIAFTLFAWVAGIHTTSTWYAANVYFYLNHGNTYHSRFIIYNLIFILNFKIDNSSHY